MIADRDELMQKLAEGKGYKTQFNLASSGSVSAAAAASNYITVKPNFLSNSSLPGTIVPIPLNGSTDNLRLLNLQFWTASTGTSQPWLARFYKFGTLNLTSLGNQFTHDAATFPVTRTVFGASAQPISLIPVIYITTQTSVTQAVFTLSNVAGTQGYVDQDGNTVVGTRTMTLPAASTLAQSGYIPKLEAGDTGVRDIQSINVTTPSTAGAATVYGMELLCPMPNPGAGNLASMANIDTIFGAQNMPHLSPASPTAGTLTSYLGVVSLGSDNGAWTGFGFLNAVSDV